MATVTSEPEEIAVIWHREQPPPALECQHVRVMVPVRVHRNIVVNVKPEGLVQTVRK